MLTYNLQEHYVDQYDPWMVILDAGLFAVFSIIHTLRGYTLGRLVFVRDMILLIKHIVEWKLIHH